MIHTIMTYHFYFWLFCALTCVGVELATPGLFFFVAFAGGCVVASGSVFWGYSFMGQCLIALGSSIVFFGILKRWVAPTKNEQTQHINTNYQGLVGKRGVVVEVIDPGSYGYVKVGGELWRARSVEAHTFTKGDYVIVVSVHGNHVRIKQAKE